MKALGKEEKAGNGRMGEDKVVEGDQELAAGICTNCRRAATNVLQLIRSLFLSRARSFLSTEHIYVVHYTSTQILGGICLQFPN